MFREIYRANCNDTMEVPGARHDTNKTLVTLGL
jgi:hypothetical protein